MVRIERAKTQDFLEIARLDRMAWTKARHSEYIPDGEHVWRIWVEHALVFCAKENGEVLGALVVFPTVSGSYCLHKVFVDEAQRGKGVGTRLMEALFVEVDTLGVDCFLTVDPTNESAIRLYEGWGFTERAFVSGYYRKQEDRFVLTRRRIETAEKLTRQVKEQAEEQGNG